MSWSSTIEERQPNFETLGTIFGRVKENIAKRKAEPELPFGIKILDDLTRGIPQNKITIIAARATEGKTSIGLQTAVNLANNGKTVAFLSLEDDRESLVERIYCQQMRVDQYKLTHESQIDPVAETIFDRLKLLILDDYGYNFDELQNIVTTLEPKPDVVFIDYVQMVEQSKKESEYEAVSRFVRQAKIFAERYEVAVVLLSQINRAGARDGRPEMHHLANCGRLEQVANLVLLLFAPFYYNEASFDYNDDGSGFAKGYCPKDYTEVLIAKNKTGARGKVARLRFVGSQYRFEGWNQMEEV